MKPIAMMCTWALLALGALCSVNSATAEEAIRVNFARSTTPTIDGWYADHGAPFADRGNGLSYGWNGDNSSTTRQRNAARSPSLQHDTLVHLQKPELPQATWEIAVPNGRYAVTLVAGDANHTDSTYRLAAEGLLAIDHKPTRAARWAEGSVEVLVLDGRLTISSVTGAKNNKLCSVIIVPLPMALQVDFTQQAPAAGWLADNGASFGHRGNGLSYGWQGAEPTLIATGSSEPGAAWSAAMNGAQWEIAVPNGIYDVAVVVAGELGVVRAHDLMIEGLYQPDIAVAADTSTLVIRVSVADGRLTIASASGAIVPALASISLAQVTGTTPAEDGLIHGLLGSWYDTEHFTQRKRLAVDPEVRFYWGGQPPWPGIDGTTFTTRWQGSLVADVSAIHNLRFRFNESVRLWIDGELVIDAWYAHKDWHDEYVDYAFTAGQAVPIVIEYRQRFNSSGVRILWKPTPGTDNANKETAYTHIPTANLLPPSDSAAPSIPESVHLSYLSPSRVQISWAASTDDVAVLGYHIARDGLRVATVLHDTIWVDEGVDPSATPVYTVEAIDWQGTLSGPSAPAETWHPLSVASTTVTSHTSPAWIEGASAPATQAIELAVDGAAATPALRLGPGLWGTDAQNGKPYGIELQQGTPSAVQVTAHGPNGEIETIGLTATWAPLLLSVAENPTTFALRAGDTLLLDVAETAGTPVAYDVGDNGAFKAQSTAGSPITLTFDNPAITRVRVIADLNNDGAFDAYTETVTVLEVTALGVDFDGPIASEVGFRREKGVEVFPLAAADTPVWDSNDPSLLEVAVIPDDQLSDEVLNNPAYNPANYGKRLWLKPTRRGTPVLLARTPSGAVMGYREVDEFTWTTDALSGLVLDRESRVGQARTIMRPFIPNLSINYSMFSHQSTFAGGLTDLVQDASSPDADIFLDEVTGEVIISIPFDIEMPLGEGSYCFRGYVNQESAHGTDASDTLGVNGTSCEVTRYGSLLFSQEIKVSEDEILAGDTNPENWNQRSYDLLTKADCPDESSDEDCEDIKYQIRVESPEAPSWLNNPFAAAFRHSIVHKDKDGDDCPISTDPQISNCRQCEHECDKLDDLDTGNIPGWHQTYLEKCGDTEKGKKLGGFFLSNLDAHGVNASTRYEFPEYACALPKRRGKLVDGSGLPIYEPVIVIASGGEKVISGGESKGIQTTSLYGVVCNGTNTWSLSAKDDGFAVSGLTRRWYRQEAGTSSKTQIGADDDITVTETLPVGRWNILLHYFKAAEIASGNSNPSLVVRAEIHSFVVESKHDQNVGPAPVASDIPNVGTPYNNSHHGDTTVDMSAFVKPSIQGARGRMSLDGYPQNEYWGLADDSLDMPQVVSMEKDEKRLMWVQGYHIPSGGYPSATSGYPSSGQIDPIQVSLDGQALIEQCGPDECGNTLSYQNDSGETKTNNVKWLWQHTDSEEIISIQIDLDIDSDNTGIYNAPDSNDNVAEDPIEDIDTAQIPTGIHYAGKYIPVNDGDVDNDNVPNFADGFNRYDNFGADAGGSFVPLILSLSNEIDFDEALIRFTYSESDPALITRKNIGVAGVDKFVYTLPPGGGHLRIWKYDGSQGRLFKSISQGEHFLKSGEKHHLNDLSDTSNYIKLWIEGIRPSASLAEQQIVVEIDPDGSSGPKGWTCADSVRVTVVNVDLDVDSDNEGGIHAPDKDWEDQIEDRDGDQNFPGAIVCVNNGDKDEDGVPDFSDGLDIHGQTGAGKSEDFSQIKLNIPSWVDKSKARVRLLYSESDPSLVVKSGSGTFEDPYIYTPAPGFIRIWKKDGGTSRRVASLANGGDFIKAGENIAWTNLSAMNEAIMYIEGINPVSALAEEQIIVQLDPDGESGPNNWISHDSIRVSIVDIDLDVDVNGDMTISNVDDAFELEKGGILIVNTDDDDNNKIADKDDPGHANEDDLKPIYISFKPSALHHGVLRLEAITGSAQVKVWDTAKKGSEIVLPKEWSIGVDPIPSTVYIEGIAKNANFKDVKLALTYRWGAQENCRDEVNITVMNVEFEPVSIEGGIPPVNSTGIAISDSLPFKIKVEPADIPEDRIKWTLSDSAKAKFPGKDEGRSVQIEGVAAGKTDIEVKIKGFVGDNPKTNLRVMSLNTVDVTVYIVRRDDGTMPATTAARVAALLLDVNGYYRQAAIKFTQNGAVQYIDKTDWLDISSASNYQEAKSLWATDSGTGGLEIYFVDTITGANGLNFSPSSAQAGLAVADMGNSRTVAHEIGHACGLDDIYFNQGTTTLPDDPVKELWAPNDWNNGDDPHYYRHDLKMHEFIQRPLMYGVTSGTKADFPRGRIHGLNTAAAAGLVKVGLDDMNRSPTHH